MIIHLTNDENIGYICASSRESAFRLVNLSTFEVFGDIYWSKDDLVHDYGDSGEILTFTAYSRGIH